jgi:hypothetical protein
MNLPVDRVTQLVRIAEESHPAIRPSERPAWARGTAQAERDLRLLAAIG